MNRKRNMANFLCTRSMILCKGRQIVNIVPPYKFYLGLEFQVSSYWVQILVYMLLDMCSRMHICVFVYVLGEIYACIYMYRFVCMFLCSLKKDTTGIRKENKYLSSSWILQDQCKTFSQISYQIYTTTLRGITIPFYKFLKINLHIW